jgi:virulence-associated protein VapD
LYNSLREAVKAARYGVYPSSLREDVPTSTEIKKLTASDGVELDFFGRSVATNGNMAIVGAPQDDIGSNSNQGSVYIFERNQGEPNNWGEVKKLTASDGAALDGFGESVAIHGDMAIVGATGDAIGDNPQGSAYIFERNQGGQNNWGEVKKLTASDDVSSLGGSVAIHGDTAIVAALGFEFFRGSVYVFSATAPGCCK